MYVPNFNFHFTLKSSVQKEAMQAKTNKQKAQKKQTKKLQWLRQTTYKRFKAPSDVQPFLQVYYDNGVLKAGAGKVKSQC